MIRGYFIFICWFFTCWSVSGQMTIYGEFKQDSIAIGGSVDFVLSVKTTTEEDIAYVSSGFLDTLYKLSLPEGTQINEENFESNLEVADVDVIDIGTWLDGDQNGRFQDEEMSWNRTSSGSEFLYEAVFTLRFWDPGYCFVKLPIVGTKSGNENSDGNYVPVFVGLPESLRGMASDSISMAPIKPILLEPANLSDYAVYIIIVGGFFVLLLSYFFWNKYRLRSKEEVVVKIPQVVIPPHEKALTDLNKLRTEKLWQKGFIKKYQTQLTHIVREYLEGRFSVRALEMTTQHIVSTLTKETSLPKSDIDSLTRILQIADLVKFAKATPNESIHESFMNEAVSFVERTAIDEPEDPQND